MKQRKMDRTTGFKTRHWIRAYKLVHFSYWSIRRSTDLESK